jgi:hypothetical protein
MVINSNLKMKDEEITAMNKIKSIRTKIIAEMKSAQEKVKKFNELKKQVKNESFIIIYRKFLPL